MLYKEGVRNGRYMWRLVLRNEPRQNKKRAATTNIMQCIYCLEEKRESEFNKEHVLPQAFGKFKNNLTLINKVCEDCNEDFNTEFETILSLDTFEGGILRFDRQVQPARKFRTKGGQSQLAYEFTTEGDYKGAKAYRTYSEEHKRIILMPHPQVGFLKKSGEYEWYRLNDIPDKKSLDLDKYDFRYPYMLKVLECNLEEVYEILGNKEFDLEVLGQFDIQEDVGGEVDGIVTRKVGDDIFRAVAKIGFNHLAYYMDRAFLLNEDFNPIRNYIRWGTKPIEPATYAIPGPFFQNERKTNVRSNAHIVAYYWEKKEPSLVACVSLFNFVIYLIRLAKDEEGNYQDLARGTFFNLQQMNIRNFGMKGFSIDLLQ